MKPKSRLRDKSFNYKVHIEESNEDIPELPSEDILKSKIVTGLPQVADHRMATARPSVQIVKCISFQKFRYSGENRPGKKYQEKEFMTLQLNNLANLVVRVVIICTDADNRELIHPNGLVGKDCHHGIYDKEYPVTRSCFEIKIPYLRTERIKINSKKDGVKNVTQTNNIQAVLSQRASHLPSPYKERCLSQCTDKYTSARKFDTTKVCLGVIITVQNQEGEYNGSLHAISHMVRNASEKTNLAIHKLSQYVVPAWDGAEIDIFTNEEGPIIEPDKCSVYITLPDVPGAEDWRSETFTPMQKDILYKKVITYTVPPIAPNYDISESVTAILHLECPQSNQYCCMDFKYTPLDNSQGYVCIENLPLAETKRAFIEDGEEEDIKPLVKKLRTDTEATDQSSEAIKANLKSKLRARQENILSEDYGGDQSETVIGASGDSGQHLFPQQPQQHVYIRHDDPHTGESSYLLDMDASKTSVHTSAADFSGHVVSSPFQAHTAQDVKVVAAGYSDAVPPNTTVLIYTDDQLGQGNTQQVVIDQSGSSIHQSQVAVRDNKRRSQGTEHVSQINQSNLRSQSPAHSRQYQTDTTSQAVQFSSPVPVSCSFAQYGFTPAPSKAPSVIPDIHRMVIPDKSMPEQSPWEVGTSEDTEDYNMCVGSMHFQPNAGVKGHSVQVPSRLASPPRTAEAVVAAAPKLSEQLVQEVDENANRTGDSCKRGDAVDVPVTAGLDSLLGKAISNNLPTFEVEQCAHNIMNGLDSVDLEPEGTTDQS